jgi:hypothetical protein
MSIRTRTVLVLSTLGLAPLLMAPGNTPCGACVQEWLNGQIGAQQVIMHQPDDSLIENEFYRVELWTNSGAQIDLDVSSEDIVGLDCDTETNYEGCTFTATGDGTVKLFLTGGQTSGTYTLQIETPE